MKRAALSCLAVLAAAGLTFAAPTTQPVTPYPMNTCVVSGEELGEMGQPIVKVYDGQEVKFCCPACVKKFEKNKAMYMKKIEDAEKNPTTKPM